MIKQCYFVLPRGYVDPYCGTTRENSSSKLHHCLCVSSPRLFDLAFDGQRQMWCAGANSDGEEVYVRYPDCEVALVSRLVENDELHNQELHAERVFHFSTQARNACFLHIIGREESDGEYFVVDDPSAVSACCNVSFRLTIRSLAETADYRCYTMWIDYLNELAARNRQANFPRRYRGLFRKYSAIESEVSQEDERIATSMTIIPGQYLPLGMTGTKPDVFNAVIRIDSLVNSIATGRLFALNRKEPLWLEEGFELSRVATVECGGKLCQARSVLGVII